MKTDIKQLLNNFITANRNIVTELDDEGVYFTTMTESIHEHQLDSVIVQFSQTLPTVNAIFSRAKVILAEAYDALTVSDKRVLLLLGMLSNSFSDATIYFSVFCYVKYHLNATDELGTAGFYQSAVQLLPMSDASMRNLWDLQKDADSPLGNLMDSLEAYQSLLNNE